MIYKRHVSVGNNIAVNSGQAHDHIHIIWTHTISGHPIPHDYLLKKKKSNRIGLLIKINLNCENLNLLKKKQILTTKWSSPITFPQIWYKILQKHGTSRVRIAPVMLSTTPIDTVQSRSRSQETTIASVPLVNQWITSGCTLDHRVQGNNTSF